MALDGRTLVAVNPCGHGRDGGSGHTLRTTGGSLIEELPVALLDYLEASGVFCV